MIIIALVSIPFEPSSTFFQLEQALDQAFAIF